MEKSLLTVWSFDQAAHKARRLAQELDSETIVRSTEKGWEVLAEQSLEDALADQEVDESEPRPPNDGYTVEEAMSDQDEAARSNEDGWPYGD